VDTNHLERGLRPVPMGRRNWLFAWTEICCAQHISVNVAVPDMLR